jgi:hypothetical protein
MSFSTASLLNFLSAAAILTTGKSAIEFDEK